DCYRQLPRHIQKQADEKFQLLKADPGHPSLHFKKVGSVWSARVNIDYRALADEENGELTGSGSVRTKSTTGSSTGDRTLRRLRPSTSTRTPVPTRPAACRPR